MRTITILIMLKARFQWGMITIYAARFSMVWTEQVMELKRCFFISTTHYS